MSHRTTQLSRHSVSWLHSLSTSQPEKRIVRSSGITERYERTKLADSIHAACMNTTGFLGEAESTAVMVCKEVEQWLEKKYEVTSSDIVRKAARALARYNPQAVYEYAPGENAEVTEGGHGLI